MARSSVRQQLMDASLGVFQAHGFNGASVQDLTDAAGVPKGSFYNHFTGKEELALETLKLYVESHGIEVLSNERLKPVERLRRHFRANWKIVKDKDFMAGCLLGSLSSEIADTHATARVQFAATFQGWSSAIARVIREAQELEQISSHVDAEVLARFVLNAWQGTLIRTKVVKTEEPFRDFNALVFDVLLA
jgi:TetR/AcrR family transcriptional repressor of nem operon